MMTSWKKKKKKHILHIEMGVCPEYEFVKCRVSETSEENVFNV